MKTKQNPLTVVILIGVAIGALFLVSHTYLSMTEGSRKAEESAEDVRKSLRDLDKAEAEAERQKERNSRR